MTDLEPISQGVDRAAIATPSIAQLVDALTQLDEARARLAEIGDWETLAWGKRNLAEFATQLRAVTGAIDADLANLVPDGQADVDGLGRIMVRWSRKRSNWQSDKLLRWLVRRALVDTDTGERLDLDADEAADRIYAEVAECMPVRPSTAWRTTPLKERGVQLDEWCEEQPAKASVSIVGAK